MRPSGTRADNQAHFRVLRLHGGKRNPSAFFAVRCLTSADFRLDDRAHHTVGQFRLALRLVGMRRKRLSLVMASDIDLLPIRPKAKGRARSPTSPFVATSRAGTSPATTLVIRFRHLIRRVPQTGIKCQIRSITRLLNFPASSVDGSAYGGGCRRVIGCH